MKFYLLWHLSWESFAVIVFELCQMRFKNAHGTIHITSPVHHTKPLPLILHKRASISLGTPKCSHQYFSMSLCLARLSPRWRGHPHNLYLSWFRKGTMLVMMDCKVLALEKQCLHHQSRITIAGSKEKTIIMHILQGQAANSRHAQHEAEAENEQESIPVGCPPLARHCSTPLTPLDRDLLPRQRPPGQISPLEGTWDQIQRLPEGTVSQTGSDIIQNPLPPWTEWRMRVKTWPCPKLRLRAVITIF